MKLPIIAIVVVAAFLAPAAGALPPQTGTQSTVGQVTVIPVDASSNFILVGIVGDHDLTFHTSSGAQTGPTHNACGNEAGIVPFNAATARVRLFKHATITATCIASGPPPPSSAFVYIDGY